MIRDMLYPTSRCKILKQHSHGCITYPQALTYCRRRHLEFALLHRVDNLQAVADSRREILNWFIHLSFPLLKTFSMLEMIYHIYPTHASGRIALCRFSESEYKYQRLVFINTNLWH